MALDTRRWLYLFRKRRELWLFLALLTGDGVMGALLIVHRDRETPRESSGEDVARRPLREWNLDAALFDRPVAHYWAPGERDVFHTLKEEATPTPFPASQIAEGMGDAAQKETGSQAQAQPLPTATGTPVLRQISAKLTGIMTGPGGERVALVLDPDTHRSVVVRIGDEVQGASVVALDEKSMALDDPITQKMVVLAIEKKESAKDKGQEGVEEGEKEAEKDLPEARSEEKREKKSKKAGKKKPALDSPAEWEEMMK